LELVQNHVPQTLVVHDTKVDVGGKLLARDAGVHRLITVVVVAGREKLLAEVVHCGVLFREPEW
jgi:hypothetical protein